MVKVRVSTEFVVGFVDGVEKVGADDKHLDHTAVGLEFLRALLGLGITRADGDSIVYVLKDTADKLRSWRLGEAMKGGRGRDRGWLTLGRIDQPTRESNISGSWASQDAILSLFWF